MEHQQTPAERVRAAATRADPEALAWALLTPEGQEGAKTTTRTGRTPLMFAASQSSVECVKLLLPWSDAKAKDGAGWDALMFAAQNGKPACVELLLPHSDPLAASTSDGWTALMLASKSDAIGVMELLMPVSDLERADDTGLTPLLSAAFIGHIPTMKTLIQGGANPDNGAKLAGRHQMMPPEATPLMAAIREENTDVVEFLLTVSDASAVDEDGWTALHWAAHRGWRKGVEMLLPLSDPDARCIKNGRTALMEAACGDKGRLIAPMLMEVSDRAIVDDRGRSPFELALEHGRWPTAEILSVFSSPRALRAGLDKPAAQANLDKLPRSLAQMEAGEIQAEVDKASAGASDAKNGAVSVRRPPKSL